LRRIHQLPDVADALRLSAYALVKNFQEFTFPETAPFALEQVLDDAYWPG
jgi:hypothetical protein